MIKIENLIVNIHKMTVEQDSDELLESQIPAVVRDELVSTLRVISEDSRLSGQTVVIPEGCEQYGFAEGEFDLPQVLKFLADML
ncbi:hypothetical protein [Psychrobacter alimentarius]|uniref:hypothetical protein n=1 Tax=Psychrobacter alimentarius TaxID=261164 RepID=UPI003FD649EA